MYGQVYCGEKMIFLKHQTDLTSYPYNTVNQMVPHVTFCEPKVPYIYLQVTYSEPKVTIVSLGDHTAHQSHNFNTKA